ncbi:MAG: hypothetical protein MPJ78_07955 [Hyphomicrobiaceae bacterium]|nr:hypothetical protein [Hyphomicrobiaceae bacterium]
MSNWRDQGPVTDEQLVAYLDGMLDDDTAANVEREVKLDRKLEARLDLLRRGDRQFEEAYGALLTEAPEKKLQEILKRVKEPPPEVVPPELTRPAPRVVGGPAQIRSEPWGGWRVLAAAIVLLAVFAGGLFSSRLLELPGSQPQMASDTWTKKGWRAAVAEYQSLFITQTLENTGKDAQQRAEGMRAVSEYLGLDLTAEKVTVGPLQLKRANVLKFGGKKLVQVAYLADGKTPVSFCIIKGKRKPHDLKQEQRLGLNIVYWDSDDFGFMVIGDVPKSELDRIARTLQQRVS